MAVSLVAAHHVGSPVDVRRFNRGWGAEGAGQPVEAEHVPFPVEVVLAVFVEGTKQRPETQILRRGDADFVVVPLDAIVVGGLLPRVGAFAEVGDVAGVEALHKAAADVPVGVERVVHRRVGLAVQVGASVSQLKAGYLALHHQGDLGPFVIAFVRQQTGHLKVAHFCWVVVPHAGGLQLLAHDVGRYRPVVAEINAQGRSGARGGGLVEVVLNHVRVVHGDVRRLGDEGGISQSSTNVGVAEGVAVGHVVDEAGVLLVPAHQPQRGAVAQRNVHHAFEQITKVAVLDGAGLQVVAGLKARRIGLVGDDANAARLGVGPKQGALRPGQRLDAGDVVNVRVEVAAHCGDGLLVEIDGHVGRRAKHVLAAAGDAANVDAAAARPQGDIAHRGQQLGEVLKVGDAEVLQFAGAEHVDADRHVLHALVPLLGGDDDFLDGQSLLSSGHRRRRHTGNQGHRPSGSQ